MAKKKTCKARTAAKARPTVKARKAAKAAKNEAPLVSKGVASQNRAEGLRLFKLAGRPTADQFNLVYGERGAKMTWAQRAAAGIPASKFQAALAAKIR